MIPLKISPSKYFYLLMLTILNLYHISRFDYMIWFSKRNRVSHWIIFQLNFSWNSFCGRTAQYCSKWPPQFLYQSTDLNPLFHSIMLKPISTLFLTFDTAMLQLHSRLDHFPLKKNNFLCVHNANFNQSGVTITIEFISFTSNFEAVHFLDEQKPLRNGPFKNPHKLTEVTYERLTRDGETFQTHRNHVLR